VLGHSLCGGLVQLRVTVLFGFDVAVRLVIAGQVASFSIVTSTKTVSA